MFEISKVARNIKNARAKKNMTQVELADIVGVSYQAVSNWERGNSMPDIAKISDIARALDLNISDLLGDEQGSSAVMKVIENSPEPLTTEELTEVAPILPPAELKEEIRKTAPQSSLNMKALAKLAPYLDDDYLDSIILEADVTDQEAIIDLAPYLSDQALRELAARIDPTDMSFLVELAPFLPDDALDDLAFRIRKENMTGLSELAPFLSDRALDRIAAEMDPRHLDEIEDLACYMTEEALDTIVDTAIACGTVSALSEIACYLEDYSLKKIVDYLLHTDNDADLTEFTQYL